MRYEVVVGVSGHPLTCVLTQSCNCNHPTLTFASKDLIFFNEVNF